MQAKNPKTAIVWRIAARISLSYALVASVWIYASDYLLARLADYPPSLISLQNYKGWLFVAVTALLLYGLIGHLLTRAHALLPAAGPGDTPRTESTRLLPSLWQGARTPLLIFLALAGAIGGIGYLVYLYQQQALQTAKANELQRIADDKAANIDHWLTEQHRNAEFLARDPLISRVVGRWLLTPTPAADEGQLLEKWLTHLKQTFAYAAVLLLDTEGQVRWGVGTVQLDPNGQALVRQALASGQVLLSDLHWHQEGVSSQINLDLIAPLQGTIDGQPFLGAVVLKIDPGQYLFPLLQTWPIASPSAETLLVRREGEEVVYLNELRHRQGTALQLRLPLTSEQLPAAWAVRGESKVMGGVDYRQVPVLAAVRPVPNTAWFLVVKVDAEEVYAPLRTLMLWVAVVGSLLIIAAGAGTALWWRQQQAGLMAERLQRELEHQALAQRFDYLSKYANDIILLMDSHGQLLEANERAVAAYGYSHEELLRLNLHDLRTPETPTTEEMAQVAHSNGLVFETIHCRKDGTYFPVEVSTRQVEVQGQSYLQSIIRDISERQQAEQALRRSEALYHAIARNIPGGVVALVDRELRFLVADGPELATLGLTQEGVKGHTVREVFSEKIRSLAEARYRQALAGETGSYEYHFRGRVLWTQFVPLHDESGTVVAAMSLTLDITERQRAEIALRESQTQFQTVIENLDEGLVIADLEGHLLHWNRAALAMHGFASLEECQRRLSEFADIFELAGMDGTVWPLHHWPLARILRGEHLREVEARIRRLKADWQRVYSYGGTLVRDASGAPRLAVVTVSDITERKQAEATQRKSEEQLSRAQEIAHLGSWELDLVNHVLTWSDEVYRIFGLRPQEFGATYEAFLERVHPDDRVAVDAAYTGSLRENRDTYEIEHRVVRQNTDEIRIVHEKCKHVRNATGQIIRSVGMVHDITERKQAEEALRESEARLRAIVRAVPDMLLVLDEEGRYLEILSAQPPLLDTDPTALKGRLISEVLPTESAQVGLNTIRQTLLTRRPQSFAYEVSIESASPRYFEARTAPLDGFFMGRPAAVLLVRDVTEQRLTEASLRQAQKMEAVGQLTGGIAHDFNNLLAVILGNLEFLAEALEQPELVDLTQRALSATERGAALIQRLLAFARRQSLQAKPVAINELVIGMTELLHRTLGEIVELKTRLAEDLAQTVIDPGQFETALLNLTINARDAMPQGGRLTIETANRWLDEDDVRTQRYQVLPGPYVMLVVSDTGSGMTPEVMEHAFEPFFTTKEVGQGSGLGLSMVYGLVKQSGGHLQLYSEVGLGTTVHLYLPAQQADTSPASAPAIQTGESPLREGQGQMILIVEDEAPVRQMAVQMLHNLGYRTVEAKTAARALQVLEATPEIVLLFTDVVLPGGQNGVELAREAQQRRPDLKALFTSGYTEAHLTRVNRHLKHSELLSKPYHKAQLADKLHALLHNEPSGGD